MELLFFAMKHDWAVIMPILLCSIVTLAVTFERWWFYRSNKVPLLEFLDKLQTELPRGINQARILSERQGGILGEVAAEASRIMAEQPMKFERLYEITTSLAVRRLERNLAALATIATIAPYLGLFGTVVRILLTFGEMARTSGAGGAADIMNGIGSALIATALGLVVAIAAVAINNYFRTVVDRYVGDFELLKLVFLNANAPTASTPASDPRRTPAAPAARRPIAADDVRI